MSRRARRYRENPVTLFSFQDIMAAVTGVVILVTLLLMLELLLRQRAVAASGGLEAAPGATAAEVAALRESLLAAAEAPTVAEVAEAEAAAKRLAGVVARLEGRAAAMGVAVREAEAERDTARGGLEAATRAVEAARREAEAERGRTRVTLLGGERGDKGTWFVECAGADVRAGRIDPDGVTRPARAFAGGDAAEAALAWALGQARDAERFVLLVRPDGVAAFDRLQRGLRGAGYEVGWDVWAAGVRVFGEPGPGEAAGGGGDAAGG